MENIVFEQSRPAMTYFPPEVDDATGQPIEGTDQVVDTRFAAFAKGERGNGEVSSDEMTVVEHGEMDFEDQVTLAEVSEEINTTTFVADDDIAHEVAYLDMGESDSAIAVQYLAHQVYAGNMSAEDAFNEAITSGLPHSELLQHWNAMKTHFANK